MLEIYFTMGEPLCLEKNKEGKYELTKEEIEKIVKDAYNAGKNSVNTSPITQPYIQPVNPTYPTYPTYPSTPEIPPIWWDKPYCIPCDSNIPMTFGSKDVIDIASNTIYTQTYATYGEDKDE